MPLIQQPSQIGQSYGGQLLGKIGGFLGNAWNGLSSISQSAQAKQDAMWNPKIGVQASSPTNNIQAPANTLPKTQVKSSTTTTTAKPSYSPPPPPVVNPNQAQMDSIQSQIAQKQALLNSANSQGLTNFDVNAQNQAIPQQQTMGANTAGGNSTQTPPVDYNGLYGQLISQLQAKSQAPSADYTKVQGQIAENLAQQKALTQDYAQKDKNIQGTAGFLTQATGLEGLLNRQYGLGQSALASQYQGLSSQLGAANTQQQLQQTGLGTAAGFAQPQLAGYNQQAFNPLTGQFSGGGTSGGLQDQVNLQVQKLLNHSTNYSQAVNDLSAYGQAGVNALQAALGPNFNINESNAQGAAQASNIQTAGQTGALVEKANAGLDSLQQAYNDLGGLQKTGGNWLSDAVNSLSENTGIGKTQTDNFNRVLNEVRASVQSVLSTAVNLGVVKSGTTVDSLLPRNMSPQGLQTAITTVKALMEQTKTALANANNAQVNQGGSSGSNVQYNSDGTLKAVSF